MSQEDTPQDSPLDSPPTSTPAEAPKKKRGFWGWLTGRADEPAPTAQEAEGAPPPEADAIAAEPEAPSDTTTPDLTAKAELPAPAEATAEEPAPEDARAEAPAPTEETPGEREPLAGPAPVAAEPPAAPEVPAETAAPAPTEPPQPAPAPETPPPAPPVPETPPEIPEPAPEPAPEPQPIPFPQDEPPPPAVDEASSASQESAAPTPLVAPLEAPALDALKEQETPATESEPTEPPAAEAPSAQDEAAPLPAAGKEPKKGFWARLASGLARTASSLGQGITDLVSKRKLDADTLEELEDVLIRADLGVETAMRIVEAVGKGRHDKMIAPDEVKGLIAAEVERILEPVAKPLVVDHLHRPFVVLMVGVNGSGKTTTIGKLASQWRHEGKKVVLAAGDTFRAAAIDQLKVWGHRTGTKVIAKEPGADAAGVAHDALTEARADGADILMIDTAGRLQNRTELMAELEKIVRVVKKLEPSAPHAVLLVLDATVGQNALSQVEAFTRIAGVTGLVMTKLDGTARGGILVAIAAKHKLPVHLIGVGEGADDLQPFTARDFARAIAGLE